MQHLMASLMRGTATSNGKHSQQFRALRKEQSRGSRLIPARSSNITPLDLGMIFSPRNGGVGGMQVEIVDVRQGRWTLAEDCGTAPGRFRTFYNPTLLPVMI